MPHTRSPLSEYTDDAALVRAAGHPVAVVDGRCARVQDHHPRATWNERGRLWRGIRSLRSIAHLENPSAVPRVGIGTDVHALRRRGRRCGSPDSNGRESLRCRVTPTATPWPTRSSTRCSSAAGLGDIGTHFGTDHPEYAGAHADAFLSRTLALLGEAGWRGRQCRRAGAGEPAALQPRAAPRPRPCCLPRSAGRRCPCRRPRPTAWGSPGGARASSAFAMALVVPA